MSDVNRDGNPKDAIGRTKTRFDLIPAHVLRGEANVLALGAKKYEPWNWRKGHGVYASVYYAAALRHLTAWFEGQDIDPESGESHLAHVRANMAIILDASAFNQLLDDRPLLPKEPEPAVTPPKVARALTAIRSGGPVFQIVHPNTQTFYVLGLQPSPNHTPVAVATETVHCGDKVVFNDPVREGYLPGIKVIERNTTGVCPKKEEIE